MVNNKRGKLPSSASAALVCLLLVCSPSAFPGSEQPKVNVAPAENLKITLSTDKPAYRVGEEVRFTITLENVGETPFYLDPILAPTFYTDIGPSLDVESFDQSGNEIRHRKWSADSFAFEFPDSWFDQVEKHYLVMRPQRFYGVKTVVTANSYEMLLKPGRYKLVASYSSSIVEFMTEKQRKRLSSLKHPLWSGDEIRSEPVWIEVID